jgi:hypothetical protein
MTDQRPQQPSGHGQDAADAVTPWPGWIRYTVLAVLFAVVGIGLVTVLYDKGFLPIAGPFVLIFLLPLLLPLRRRGLRGRVGRLGRRLGEQLAVLEPALEKERALAPHERPTGADDEVLAEAASQVAAARRQLASGQESLAADTVEGLDRSTADGWPRRAPVRGQVAGAARTALTLHGVLRQLGEPGPR